MLVLIHVLHDARFGPEMAFLAYLKAVLEAVQALIPDPRIHGARSQAVLTPSLEPSVVGLLLHSLLG